MKKAKSLRVGNGAHKDTDVGPLISPEAKERAVRLITGGIHQARQLRSALQLALIFSTNGLVQAVFFAASMGLSCAPMQSPLSLQAGWVVSCRAVRLITGVTHQVRQLRSALQLAALGA